MRTVKQQKGIWLTLAILSGMILAIYVLTIVLKGTA